MSRVRCLVLIAREEWVEVETAGDDFSTGDLLDLCKQALPFEEVEDVQDYELVGEARS